MNENEVVSELEQEVSVEAGGENAVSTPSKK